MASFTYLTTITSTADLATYSGGSFNGVSIGDADAGRAIFLVPGSRSTSGTTFSSASVGGVSTTTAASATTGSGTVCGASIAGARVPTGTTADLSVTYAASQLRTVVHVFRAIGIDPARVTDTFTVPSTSSDPQTFTLTNGAGDLVIAASSRSGTTGVVWSDITEYEDTSVESLAAVSAAADIRSAAETDDTFTVTGLGSGNTVVAASFGLLRPENTSVPTFNADTGDFTVGSWDSFTNGAILYTVLLKDDFDDSTVATLLTSSASTSGNCLSDLETAGDGSYYILVSAANDGGTDTAADTASAVDTYTSGGGGSALPAIVHHYRQLMTA